MDPKAKREALLKKGVVPIVGRPCREDIKKEVVRRLPSSLLGSKLDSVEDGIIGLPLVTEYHPIDDIPTYSNVWHVCNLCNVKATLSSIVPHLLGQKHRYAYLKKNYPDIMKKHKKSDVEELSKIVENKEGRNKPKVEFDPESKKNEVQLLNPKSKRIKKLIKRTCLTDQPSKLEGQLAASREALIGLHHIIEFQCPNEQCIKLPPIHYYCEMCDCSLGPVGAINHVIGRKHRINYMEHYYPAMAEEVKRMTNVSRKSALNTEIEIMAFSIAKSEVTRKIRVCIENPKFVLNTTADETPSAGPVSDETTPAGQSSDEESQSAPEAAETPVPHYAAQYGEEGTPIPVSMHMPTSKPMPAPKPGPSSAPKPIAMIVPESGLQKAPKFGLKLEPKCELQQPAEESREESLPKFGLKLGPKGGLYSASESRAEPEKKSVVLPPKVGFAFTQPKFGQVPKPGASSTEDRNKTYQANLDNRMRHKPLHAQPLPDDGARRQGKQLYESHHVQDDVRSDSDGEFRWQRQDEQRNGLRSPYRKPPPDSRSMQHTFQNASQKEREGAPHGLLRNNAEWESEHFQDISSKCSGSSWLKPEIGFKETGREQPGPPDFQDAREPHGPPNRNRRNDDCFRYNDGMQPGLSKPDSYNRESALPPWASQGRGKANNDDQDDQQTTSRAPRGPSRYEPGYDEESRNHDDEDFRENFLNREQRHPPRHEPALQRGEPPRSQPGPLFRDSENYNENSYGDNYEPSTADQWVHPRRPGLPGRQQQNFRDDDNLPNTSESEWVHSRQQSGPPHMGSKNYNNQHDGDRIEGPTDDQWVNPREQQPSRPGRRPGNHFDEAYGDIPDTSTGEWISPGRQNFQPPRGRENYSGERHGNSIGEPTIDRWVPPTEQPGPAFRASLPGNLNLQGSSRGHPGSTRNQPGPSYRGNYEGDDFKPEFQHAQSRKRPVPENQGFGDNTFDQCDVPRKRPPPPFRGQNDRDFRNNPGNVEQCDFNAGYHSRDFGDEQYGVEGDEHHTSLPGSGGFQPNSRQSNFQMSNYRRW